MLKNDVISRLNGILCRLFSILFSWFSFLSSVSKKRNQNNKI